MSEMKLTAKWMPAREAEALAKQGRAVILHPVAKMRDVVGEKAREQGARGMARLGLASLYGDAPGGPPASDLDRIGRQSLGRG